MTKVYGAEVTLKEDQTWKLKGFLKFPDGHFATRVRILAVGKTFSAVQDLNAESQILTVVVNNDTFAREYALVLE